MSTIEERTNLRKKEKIHSHLRYWHFVMVKFLYFCNSDFNLEATLALFEWLLCQKLYPVQQIIVVGANPRIMYELWNINCLLWWYWNIATVAWELDYWWSNYVCRRVLFSILLLCTFQGECDCMILTFECQWFLCFYDFNLVFALSVLLSFMTSNDPFGVLKLS